VNGRCVNLHCLHGADRWQSHRKHQTLAHQHPTHHPMLAQWSALEFRRSGCTVLLTCTAFVYGICMCPMARMYCTRYQAILDDLRSRGPSREEDQSVGAGIMRLVVGVAWPLFMHPHARAGTVVPGTKKLSSQMFPPTCSAVQASGLWPCLTPAPVTPALPACSASPTPEPQQTVLLKGPQQHQQRRLPLLQEAHMRPTPYKAAECCISCLMTPRSIAISLVITTVNG
jgi:hypothetical protein